MSNYEVKTQVRGLPRADGSREPVGDGEVVALPLHIARDLQHIGAVIPTDADITTDLDWSLFGRKREAAPVPATISVVAVTDRYALVDAIADLGGLVFFPGEGLPGDAFQVLADFPNEQLLEELVVRIGEKRLDPALMGAVAKMLELGEPEDGDATAPIESAASEAPPPVDSATAKTAPVAPIATDPPVAPVRSSRKPKVEPK